MKGITKAITFMSLILLMVSSCVKIDKKEDIIINPPQIADIDKEYAVVEGEILNITPSITNGLNAKYSWSIDGKEVAATSKLSYLAKTPGVYRLTLIVSNEGGSDKKEAKLTVLSKTAPPVITGLLDKYVIKENEELALVPKITGSGEINVDWYVNGKKEGNDSSFKFTSAKADVYTIKIVATNKGGKAEKTIEVEVIKRGLPPTISNIKEKYEIPVGQNLLLTPSISSTGKTKIEWFVDGKLVSEETQYTFTASKADEYQIRLKVTDEVSSTEVESLIVTRQEKQDLQTTIHKIFTLPLLTTIPTGQEVKLVVANSPSQSKLHRASLVEEKTATFLTYKAGDYELHLLINGAVAEIINIKVEEKTNKRSPYISKVFDYMPAPGQFVNKLPEYSAGDTHKDMVEKANQWLVGENPSMITLGGWGGYVIFGFDHTIVNVEGYKDFRVNGNAFQALDNKRPNAPAGGSCEPGIIMVAYDKNKNGKPDDEWYEIKGSSNFSSENEPWYHIALENGNDVDVYRDYEMTYTRPTKEDAEEDAQPDNPMAYISIKNYIPWSDNKGNSGYKVKNVYHKQSYYPMWITDNELTFRGIRLPENAINEGKYNPGINAGGVYFVLYSFKYGYVDNKPNNDNGSAIDIDWAIDKDGNPANLPGIDFIKVYNGVNQENGWLGECSTEVERGEDLHLLGKQISATHK